MATIKSIEEKAKAYDGNYKAYTELINRLEDVKEAIKKQNYGIAMNVLCKPYPEFQVTKHSELKESENDRIRKLLIEAVIQVLQDQYCSNRGVSKEKVVAWLEKQGNLMKALQISNARIGELIEKNYYLKEQLEKQGKNNMGISETTKQKLEDNLNKALEKETPESWNEFLEKQGSKKETLKERNICDTCEDNNGCLIPCCAKLLEKQGEQKPYKVEPKFNKGEWIINNEHNNVAKVLEIDNEQYRLDYCDTIGTVSVELIDNDYHLWTIQDAKDGDVLATKAGGIFIYKELLYDKPFAYCGVDKFGVFKDCNCGDGLDWTPYLSDVTPATKEQRDTLLKAMADTGYTFDFEKKELKKIEPRQEELTEFEKAVKQVMEEAIECGDTHNLKADADLLLRLVQKSSWGEEDIELLDNTIKFIEDRVAATSPSLRTYSPTLTGKEIPFLKALKDRVQPKQDWKQKNMEELSDFENAMMHIGNSFFGDNAGLDPNDTNAIKEQANLLLELVPSKEWSEEDNRICKAIIDNIQAICEEGYFVGNIDSDELIKWLKSLKDRYTWRPSDEQMSAINTAINVIGKGTINGKYLIKLQEQLKKLREK